MRKALVIGISGQDGAYLARHLLGLGHEVTGTSRAGAAPPANIQRLGLAGRVKIMGLDPTDAEAVDRLVEQVKPDDIYMLSALTSVAQSFADPAGAFAANAVATMAVLEALRRRSGIRAFFAGSSECFGETEAPATCETPLRPGSPYATAKAFAFWQVRTYRQAYGLHASTGILFSHESPLRAPGFVTRKVVSAAVRIKAGSGETLRLGALWPVRDWGWAPDYVEAMAAMLECGQPADAIIATGRSVSLEYVVERIFAELDLDWRDHVQSEAADDRPTNIRRSLADVSATCRDLGWRARTDVDGMVRLLIECERTGGAG
jgi:GDPmannose 4,6-dehydratase